MNSALLTLVISSVFAAIGWLFKTERDKRTEVEKQLSQKKYDVYQGVIQLFIDIVNGARTGVQLDPLEAQARTIELMKVLIIYASDPVLKKFTNLRLKATPETPYVNLKLYYEVLLEIRKDMGHSRTTAREDNMIGIFISDYPAIRDEILRARI